MANYQEFDSCPKCGAKSGALTFRNIYQCNSCGKHYCDQCSASNYSCPHCRSTDVKKVGESH